jgi:hypothetical protein
LDLSVVVKEQIPFFKKGMWEEEVEGGNEDWA